MTTTPLPMHVQTAQLAEELLQALKAWHKETGQPSPANLLRNLLLFRQIEQQGFHNPRQTTHTLLTQALEQLAAQDGRTANLLRARFLENETGHLVANRLNISEATLYRQQNEAIHALAQVVHTLEAQAQATHRARWISRLPPPNYSELLGRAEPVQRLTHVLLTPTAPWLIAITGMGGLGKTTLADALMREMIEHGGWDELGW